MEFDVSAKGFSTRAVALTVVALFHLALVYVANRSFLVRDRVTSVDTPLHYLILPTLPRPSAPEITLPTFLAVPPATALRLPAINALQIEADKQTLDAPPASYSFPAKQADKYQHLFDPRLRERLQNLKHFTKSKTRSLAGIQILDLGDGLCELTSVGTSSTGMPSESATVKCGNNESEQMIENMEKARRDPLGLQ